ncbi:hypothetical protein TrLO_g7648 [Triparma laevis f. longispina]|uniref:Sfi1 spindle body domain-containing protein n=1 Tax=Triparma laevis f. longispina TaxID=1714387 RepID=A0A9W7E3X1_9STRA|nr:hypothetical protein TrLO_g7648 [Triparma laevis f. longispina]
MSAEEDSFDILDQLDSWTTVSNGRSHVVVPTLPTPRQIQLSSPSSSSAALPPAPPSVTSSSLSSYHMPKHQQNYIHEYKRNTQPRFITGNRYNPHGLHHTNLVQSINQSGSDLTSKSQVSDCLSRLQTHSARLKIHSLNMEKLISRHDFYSDLSIVRSEGSSPKGLSRSMTMGHGIGINLNGELSVSHKRVWSDNNTASPALAQNPSEERSERQGTVEYFRGSRRTSIFEPMSSLEKSVTINESRNELFSPPSPEGYRRRQDDFRNLSLPNESSDLPIELTGKGERALRSFIVKKRAAAFRIDLDKNVLLKSFKQWKDSTKAKEKARASLIRGEAHWEIFKCTGAMRHWRSVAKISSWKRKMLNMGVVFCDKHRIEALWTQWKHFVVERRKWKFADQHFHRKLTNKSLHIWTSWLKEHKELQSLLLLTLAHWVFNHCKKGWTAWKLYVRSRRFKKIYKQMALKKFRSILHHRVISTWKIYVVESKKMKIAWAYYDNNRLKMCWSFWVEFLEDARRLNNARAWFVDRLKCKSIETWKLVVEMEEKIRKALEAMTERGKNRCWECWKVYVQMRRVKGEKKLEAEAHFERGLQASCWANWVEYVAWRRRRNIDEETAQIFYDEKAVARAWGGWLQWLEEKKLKKEAQQYGTQFYEKKLAHWGLASFALLVSQDHKEFKQKSTVAKQYASTLHLRRHLYAWMEYLSDSKRLAWAFEYFEGRLKRVTFDALVDYVVYRASKQTQVQFGIASFEQSTMKKFVSRLIENVGRRRHMRALGKSSCQLYQTRKVETMFKRWEEAVREIVSLRAKSWAAAEHWDLTCKRLWFQHAKRTVQQKRQQHECLQIADDHHAKAKQKLGFDNLSKYALRRKKRDDLSHTAVEFSDTRILSKTLGAWKIFWTLATRQKRLVENLYSAFQFASLGSIFERWVAFHVLSINSRRLLSRWSNLSKQNRQLRRVAKWWKNALIARTFESWAAHVDELKRIRKALAIWAFGTVKKCFVSWREWAEEKITRRTEYADISGTQYRNFRFKKAIERWHLWAVESGAKTKLIKKALMWMQGSTLMKMFYNWNAFVEQSNAMRKAVMMWQLKGLRKCYWAWCNYIEDRREGKRLKALGDTAREETLLLRAMDSFKYLVSDDAKKMRYLLTKAALLFQGSVLMKCMMMWKEMVLDNHRLRKAVAMFSDALRIRCFSKLRRYKDLRIEKKLLMERSKKHCEMGRKTKGLRQFKRLVREEVKEFKRKIAAGMAWMRDSTKIRCFLQWREYVKEMKQVRHAMMIFTNGLLFRCLRRWRIYLQFRATKREREEVGDSYYARKASKKFLKRWVSKYTDELEFKIKIRSSLSWFTNATLKRCMMEWMEMVAFHKKIRHAMAMFTADLKVKKWFQWKAFVVMQKQKRALYSKGDEFFRVRALEKGLQRLRGEAEEGLTTKNLLLKARCWFSDIVLYKTFQTWKASVGEIKMIRHAVLIFQGNHTLKCFMAWTRFVLEEKEMRTAVAAAVKVWKNIVVGKCWRSWVAYWDWRKTKLDMNEYAEEFYKKKAAKEGMKKWKEWREGREERRKEEEYFEKEVWAPKALKRAMGELAAHAEWTRKIRWAVKVWECGIVNRIFGQWKVNVGLQILQREMDEVVKEADLKRMVRKGFRMMRENVVIRAANWEMMSVAVEHRDMTVAVQGLKRLKVWSSERRWRREAEEKARGWRDHWRKVKVMVVLYRAKVEGKRNEENAEEFNLERILKKVFAAWKEDTEEELLCSVRNEKSKRSRDNMLKKRFFGNWSLVVDDVWRKGSLRRASVTRAWMGGSEGGERSGDQ